MILLSLVASSAFACPTIATGNAHGLAFDTAQVAIVRQGNHTTFTVSINPAGEPDDMALVMPVPALLAEEDVRVIDAAVFGDLASYTGILTMPDAGCSPSSGGMGDGGGGADDSASSTSDGSVHVEAEYHVGGYVVSVLSATESAGLFDWLTEHGYGLPEAVIPALQQHIDDGMFFMAAQVDAEAAVADGAFLAPLQVAYDSEVWSVPIRLAALTSPGEQDMILYTLTDNNAQGRRVGISNYPELEIADKCIWGEAGKDDFAAFYDTRFRPAWEAAGSAAWAVEWAGTPWSCSPCSGTWLSEEDLSILGFVGDPSEHWLTRIHMRYTPETATQDLMLYTSGLDESRVTSFADANRSNAECIEGCVDSPGATWLTAHGYDDQDQEDEVDEEGSDAKGCANAGGRAGSALLAMAAGLLLMRRRRDGTRGAHRDS